MTPVHASRRRRKRAVVVALTAASLFMGGAGAAGREPVEDPAAPSGMEAGMETAASTGEPTTETSPTPTHTAVEASPSPAPSPLPTGGSRSSPTYRLRARVKPGPSAVFGTPQTFDVAMEGVRKGACQQTHNVLWDGKPKVSRVKLKMIREQGDPETAWADPPSGACAGKEQLKSGYKIRVKVSYPTPSGARLTTGKLKLAKGFAVLAERMNAMRDRVLESGSTARFKLKLVRVKKPVPGMISGLAHRYSLSVTKSLSVAKCESGFNPKAYNPAGPWAGVYQQDTDYWPQRAKKFGHPGESVFNAYANIDVSLRMARSMGWSHWACA